MTNLKIKKINVSYFFLTIISFILIFLVYKPVLEKSKEVRCNYQNLDEEYKKTNKDDNKINKVKNQIQEIDSKIKVKRLSIPSEIKQKDVIELLEKFRLKSQLEFYNISFSKFTQNIEQESNIIGMYIDYEFSGDYNQFKNLLSIINKSNKKIVIEQLQMKKEYDNNIKGSMTMVLYGVKDESS